MVSKVMEQGDEDEAYWHEIRINLTKCFNGRCIVWMTRAQRLKRRLEAMQ